MPCYKKQQGLALLLFMLVLLSIGGVLLTASLQKTKQEIDDTRYQHNKRVLNEAKQMLLFHAYRYPNFNSETKGPGYLPCPYDTETGYSGSISTVICEAVGRFPFNLTNLGFHEVKDASGELLWYAVSENFYTLGSTTFINSNTKGTISIYDQAANLIYDGASDGIAAIIIAPGPRINRDDNGDEDYDYEQVRITSANKLNPKNYLDAFGGFDNAVFQNGSSILVDSFILGPNFNADKSEIVINDQIMIVTTEEVLEMAQKSVLEQYSFAIEDYRSKTGGVYPWLFNYITNDINTYPANNALSNVTNIGRIPSVFSNYFEASDGNAFDSEISLEVRKTLHLRTSSEPPLSLSIVLDIKSFLATNVQFSVGAAADEGELDAEATGQFFEQYKYYYWHDSSPPHRWVNCLPPAQIISGCDRNLSGFLNGGVGNNRQSIILRVGLSYDMTGDVNFKMDYSSAPSVTYSAANATEHSVVKAFFFSPEVNAIPVNIFYERMDEYKIGDTAFVVDSSASQNIANNTDMGVLVNQSFLQMEIGVRYYPELPSWAAPDKSDWNSRIQMAIATEYEPGGNATDCSTHADGCLQISDLGGNNTNKIAILAVAGQGDFIDEANDGFANDVSDIFDAENANLDFIFTGNVLSGSDRLFVIQEQ